MDKLSTFTLPAEITFGCATASAQIEGGDTNHSWYDWSITKGHIADNTSTLRANDHWNQYERDLLLMASMGIKEYRFSIEWSRIEPKEGVFDASAVDRYKKEINMMLSLGIRPLVTLHHFSNPLWFEKKGAFTSDDSVDIFSRYVSYIVKAFKDIVQDYITINEPNVYAVNGYVFGLWPPGNKSIKSYFRVLENMAKCHIAAYRLIHEIYGDRRVVVGFANHLRIFVSYNRNPINKVSAKLMSYLFQDLMTEAMSSGMFRFPLRRRNSPGNGKYYDFIGINYYSRSAVRNFRAEFLPGKPVNDLGWEIYPEGLSILMRSLFEKYRAPIYITENGTCDAKDAFRARFIYDHVKTIADAGLPVERYYYWTLMDNFEWAEGESAPFGLIAYNFSEGQPVPRRSAAFYTDLIRNYGVTQEMIDTYL